MSNRMTLPYDWKMDEMNTEDYLRDKTEIEKNENGDSDEVVENELYSLDLPESVMKKIHPAKLRAATLYMSGNYTINQIASIVGVVPNTVHRWLRSNEVTQVVEKLQERDLKLSQVHLSSLREKAIETMNDLLNSNMDNVRFSAARDILDRSGMKAVTVQKIDKTITTLDQQMADLADFVIDDDEVVDIDFDDVGDVDG